jgi:hypothetical protein
VPGAARPGGSLPEPSEVSIGSAGKFLESVRMAPVGLGGLTLADLRVFVIGGRKRSVSPSAVPPGD